MIWHILKSNLVLKLIQNLVENHAVIHFFFSGIEVATWILLATNIKHYNVYEESCCCSNHEKVWQVKVSLVLGGQVGLRAPWQDVLFELCKVESSIHSHTRQSEYDCESIITYYYHHEFIYQWIKVLNRLYHMLMIWGIGQLNLKPSIFEEKNIIIMNGEFIN